MFLKLTQALRENKFPSNKTITGYFDLFRTTEPFMQRHNSTLSLKYLGIDTYTEPVIYMRKDCHICLSEGFEAQARVQVTLNNRSLIATLNTIDSDILHHNEASLSQYAWNFLAAKENDIISIVHPKPLRSQSFIRSKVYNNDLTYDQINEIISDVVKGRLSDIDLATFLTATSGHRLNITEILYLTQAMINSGEKLKWSSPLVVDKHCIGGVPGNRTSLIIVPIVAAFGLTIPKTSSRAITSPAGTADTMEIFAPVNLDIKSMQRVVEKENGCIIWGGSVSLSPADDILIRVERSMELDSEGQLIASILSKKIAAGSTRILIDIPTGETAKIRSSIQAENLKNILNAVADKFSIYLKIVLSEGSYPVGYGIGPALESQDILDILICNKNAPQDLRERSLMLAGNILEFSDKVRTGEGRKIAESILDNGQALKKFEAICKAQGGGIPEIPKAPYSKVIIAAKSGTITKINNRQLGRLAKLSGAPNSKVAGIRLKVNVNSVVEQGQPLYIIYAATKGELNYALDFHRNCPDIMKISEIT